MWNQPNRDAHHPERQRWLRVGFIAALSLAGCKIQHSVDVKPTEHTVKIEPIYMTVDINLRIQRELDDFYRDIVADAGTPPEVASKQGGQP